MLFAPSCFAKLPICLSCWPGGWGRVGLNRFTAFSRNCCPLELAVVTYLHFQHRHSNIDLTTENCCCCLQAGTNRPKYALQAIKMIACVAQSNTSIGSSERNIQYIQHEAFTHPLELESMCSKVLLIASSSLFFINSLPLRKELRKYKPRMNRIARWMTLKRKSLKILSPCWLRCGGISVIIPLSSIFSRDGLS